MANTVAVKFLATGTKYVTIAVFLKSDGVSGELVTATLIDPVADLGLPKTTRFTILSISNSLAGFDAILEFDSGKVDPNFKWVLVEGANSPESFVKLGGIRDDSGVDGSGKLQLSTSGFVSSQDFGSILIQLRVS